MTALLTPEGAEGAAVENGLANQCGGKLLAVYGGGHLWLYSTNCTS
jgi:hypothetical protein